MLDFGYKKAIEVVKFYFYLLCCNCCYCFVGGGKRREKSYGKKEGRWIEGMCFDFGWREGVSFDFGWRKNVLLLSWWSLCFVFFFLFFWCVWWMYEDVDEDEEGRRWRNVKKIRCWWCTVRNNRPP